MSRLLDGYVGRLTMACYRPNSIKARASCVRSFALTLDGRELEQATRLDVETYLSRDLRPETRRAYRGHLRAFYGWAVEQGYMQVDPTVGLGPVRVPRTVPRPISEDELTRALAAGDARMKAWLLLMALGGLRCLEVAGLRPRDLEPNHTGVLLRLRECKGGGTATVPAHPLILDALDRVPIRNDAWWECSAHYVSTVTAAHLRQAGIDATAHQLRHFAGTAWYRASGHDLLATANLLRHASVQTVQVYSQLDPVRPREVVDAVRLRLQEPSPALAVVPAATA